MNAQTLSIKKSFLELHTEVSYKLGIDGIREAAKHETITAYMTNMGKHQQELETVVGRDTALQLIISQVGG